MDKLRMQSTNGVQENIEKIQLLFPDCVTDLDTGFHVLTLDSSNMEDMSIILQRTSVKPTCSLWWIT